MNGWTPLLRSVLMTLSVLLSFGCSNQTYVHLYRKYLSDTEVADIKGKLEQHGYHVEVNQLDFPTSISSNTLLYSLMLKTPSDIEEVGNLVATSGFTFQHTSPLTSGNHWYKKNSLALFILPRDSETTSPLFWQDLVHEFITDNCDSKFYLQLHHSGQYQLFKEDEEGKILLLASGSWHYRMYPYLELRENSQEQNAEYYQISQFHQQDKVSDIEMLRLTPLSSHIMTGKCDFDYGERLLAQDG